MRLKTIKVRKTGPIDALDIRFGDVNLIVGNNEEGKTTLTDILIRSIFGRKNSYNKPIWSERFEPADGAEFETEGAPPSEEALKFTSLYVIREGDMRWLGKSKSDMLSKKMWNDDIKEILYGSDEIYSRVGNKSKVVELMGVSPGKGWLQKFAAGVEELSRTVEDGISGVEEYKKNESRLAALRKQMSDTAKKLESMTDARKVSTSMLDRELIEKFFKKNDELAAAAAERAKLEKKELARSLENWENLEREKVRLEKEISLQDAGKSSLEERKKEKLSALAGIKKKADAVGDRLREMELEKKKRTVELESENRNDARDREKWTNRSYRTAGTVLSAFLVFFLSAMALTGVFTALVQLQYLPMEELMLPGLVAFCGSVLGATVLMIVRLVRTSSMKKETRRLDDHIQKFRAEWDVKIQALENEIGRTKEEFSDYRNETLNMERDITAIENGLGSRELERLKKELENARSALADLVRVHQSYQNAMQENQKLVFLKEKERSLSEEIMETGAKLKTKFNTDSIAALGEELKNLRKGTAEANAESHYNEELFGKLSDEKDAFNDQVISLTNRNVQIRTEVQTRIERGLEVLKKDDKNKYVETFYSETAAFGLDGDIFNIFAFHEKIAAFASKVREDIRLSDGFLDVFDRVQSDVRSLIGAVLHTDRFRTALAKLTNGRYTGIEAREEEGELTFSLKGADGVPYPMRDLSTGTRNQAYFAVRLSLAQNFFTGEKGVFLLDDAFLTFDENRRQSALELMADYAREGWQIIYASVNERNMEGLFDKVFGKKLNKIVLKQDGVS